MRSFMLTATLAALLEHELGVRHADLLGRPSVANPRVDFHVGKLAA